MVKVYTEQLHRLPPVDQREALRYANVHGDVGEELLGLFDTCVQKITNACTARVCYCTLTKEELFAWIPQTAACRADSFSKAERFIVFVATIGIEMDRLMMKYAKLSPIKALLFQALGTERIETVCDIFCEKISLESAKEGLTTERRYSPGYGNFSLTAQDNIFQILCPQKNIGVALTDSRMMSPTKSVSAVIPLIKSGATTDENRCKTCGMQGCEYKRD